MLEPPSPVHLYDNVWWAGIAADAIKTVLAALVTLLVAVLIGNSLTARNDALKKKRELDLNAAQRFFDLYGEFFAVWKLWNSVVSAKGIPFEFTNLPDLRWNLYARAAAAEGQVESLMVKVVTERSLDESDLRRLGQFRQAYQTLRESIRYRKAIEWHGSATPEYVAFKKLACAFAQILEGDTANKLERAQNQLRTITSNRHEKIWYKTESVDVAGWM